MKRTITLFITLLLIFIMATGCGSTTGLSPNNPVSLTMWHVYGEQADSPMNKLIGEFNDTVGKEKGIVVNVTNMSNSTQIGNSLLEAQNGEPGALEMPDLFFGHVNNAVSLGIDNLLDWKECFSEEELSEFVDGFIKDGMVEEHLMVLPVSKSTHLLFINGSQFQRFSEETGITEQNLKTWEGFFDVAAKYYDWSHGKAFCSFDFLIRSVELCAMAKEGNLYTDDEWFDFSDEKLKDSWMEFARALVQGHIVVSDLYSNTKVMTGETLAGMGSSAAILYYNDVVTYSDNTSEPTNLMVLPMPHTKGGKALMTQAGVGLCAYKTTPEKREAASIFAHWLTDSERNFEFVIQTGYMPVKKDVFDRIEGNEFQNAARHNLYIALEDMITNYTAVSEPSSSTYYGNTSILYDSLRKMQKELKQRAADGEDVEALAEYTWTVFSNI